eukprot:gb/GECG01013980.1/.p1 GENE.gb/GECG01013980.1/~~gb/GECG01013980.1/.p1  ORF type:complete len:415 (+),score=63.83 gb/GECG01013980.1/:1-1245(+)
MKRRGMNPRSPPPSPTAPVIDRESGGSSSEAESASESSDRGTMQPPHGGDGGRGPPPPPSNTVGITVRTLDDSFQVNMDPKKDVSELKQRLRTNELADQCSGKLMRLIFMGKMLEEGKTLQSYGLKQGSIIHVALNDDPSSSNSGNNSRAGSQTRTGSNRGQQPPRQNQQNHSNEGGGGEEEGNRGYIDDPVLRTRGFGRLRQIGLDDHQIQAIRTAHREDIQSIENEVPRTEGESESERIARLEEQWMHRQGPYSEFALNMRMVMFSSDHSNNSNSSEGTGSRAGGSAPSLNFWRRRNTGTEDDQDQGNPCMEFFCGFLLGFFFGFFTLIWATCTGTSARMRAGIVCGIGLNILSQVARVNYEEQQHPSSSSSTPKHHDYDAPGFQFPDWPHLSGDGFGFSFSGQSHLRGSHL